MQAKKKNFSERCVIVPNYGDNQIIHAKTLENIIKQSGIPKEKFFER
jgi:predicted RNA binding protein YcfA (HicA-like mRNA interferase family)